MSLSEFDIIKNYFTSGDTNPDLVAVGIGDDAAIINVQADEQLVISVDTLNSGIHFPEQSAANDIGYKALAVNLSDLAAMGARPRWFTLAVSLPAVDEDWLKEFSQGLLKLAHQYELCLVGGDTTRGPLSITVQIAGTVPIGKALQRSGARVDDDIYVTGTLGDAAAALAITEKRISAGDDETNALLSRLNRPIPRVEAGQQLLSVASACIDISDGFAADLGHILESSHVGAEIELASLPASSSLSSLAIDDQQRRNYMLFGGDDYELCFTAPASGRAKIEALSDRLSCTLTRVGKIISEPGIYAIENAHRQSVDIKGFDHFGL